MLKEIKIPNIEFTQQYMINEEGQIWSPYAGGRFLKPSPTQKGYYRIVLATKGENSRKTFQVHRLVLMAFNPVDNMDALEVNHIDGDKGNNRLSNLEWVSGSLNVRHSLETGLKTPARGEAVGGNILTEQEVITICELLKENKYSLSQIGERFGVSKHCIFDIKRKRSWAWLTQNYNFN